MTDQLSTHAALLCEWGWWAEHWGWGVGGCTLQGDCSFPPPASGRTKEWGWEVSLSSRVSPQKPGKGRACNPGVPGARPALARLTSPGTAEQGDQAQATCRKWPQRDEVQKCAHVTVQAGRTCQTHTVTFRTCSYEIKSEIEDPPHTRAPLPLYPGTPSTCIFPKTVRQQLKYRVGRLFIISSSVLSLPYLGVHSTSLPCPLPGTSCYLAPGVGPAALGHRKGAREQRPLRPRPSRCPIHRPHGNKGPAWLFWVKPSSASTSGSASLGTQSWRYPRATFGISQAA